MDGEFTYQDFDLSIEPRVRGRYRARVLRSPAGECAPVQFTLPFSAIEVENFVLKVGLARSGTRGPGRPESALLKDFGGKLYGAVFQDELRDTLLRSLSLTRAAGAGLRLRLRLTDTPELAELPWEFLYDRRLNRFLVQSRRTPLVRYLDLPDPPKPLTVDGPLRLLVMISSPTGTGYAPLDVERELRLLTEALAEQQGAGRVIVEKLAANMGTLRRRLRREEFHVFHFVGHGRYRTDWDDGVLVMEDRNGQAQEVTGEELGGLLNDCDSTRLTVLNACEGARSSARDPFAGVAQSLIQQGLPAVVAMQFAITDDAAIIFARELYGAIADGYPLEAALAGARGAIRDEGNPTEWGTPVLYSRAPDGRLFDVTGQARKEEARKAQEEAKHQAQAKPAILPKLELSTTVIDFGRLSLRSESPERRVRLGNAGGGSLNARPVTQADWLGFRQDGDELVVSVDTSAAGEHEGAVTVDSDGGSATIRVQAHIVPDIATKEETGTHRKSISAKTPDEGAAFPSPTLAEPSPVITADAKETIEDREQASVGHSLRIPAVGSATQETKIPPDGSGTPGWQPRRLSGRARILIWVSAGIAAVAVVLIAVLIPVLTSSHATSPSAGAGNPTSSPSGASNPAPSPTWPFREDFSTTANGWTTVSGTGRYSNGTYRISVRSSDAWGFAAPTGVPGLNPVPQKITIKASARQIAGGDNTFYGIACRESKSGDNGYEFEINDNGYASIDKFVSGVDNTFAENFSPPVHANGTNQLQAACTSVGGQNAVHLTFWVNGTKVIDKTDRNDPITGGTVGLIVATAADTGTVEAEFDNFVVTKT